MPQIMGSRTASQIMSFSENELFISDYGLVPGNDSGQHIGHASHQRTPHEGQRAGCSTVVALLESAVLLGQIIPRISADNERFYPDILKGSVFSVLFLWACLHQPTGAG